MSKEWLENIYKRLENTMVKLGRQNGKTQAVKDLIYLFEQAKLSQDLQKQNKRYREVIKVIEKYANDCIDVEVEMNPYLVIDDIKTLEGME